MTMVIPSWVGSEDDHPGGGHVACGPLPCGWCQVSGVAPWGGVISTSWEVVLYPVGGVRWSTLWVVSGVRWSTLWVVSGVRCGTLGRCHMLVHPGGGVMCHMLGGHVVHPGGRCQVWHPGVVSCVDPCGGVICWVASGSSWECMDPWGWCHVLGMHGPLGAVSAGRCQLGGVIWWEVVVCVWS